MRTENENVEITIGRLVIHHAVLEARVAALQAELAMLRRSSGDVMPPAEVSGNGA